ncbi:MAG: helix-turn-helix domain-containing protein [Vicinamibacterales bacterium]
MAAIGNLNDFVSYSDGQGLRVRRRRRGRAAAELAVGFGLAQQMMQQGFAGGQATPIVAAPAGASALPELVSPAEAAQVLGVTEADVLSVLESGELKGKKIGATWRISRPALTSYLPE